MRLFLITLISFIISTSIVDAQAQDNTSSDTLKSRTVAEFAKAYSSKENADLYLTYMSGVIDATMNLGGHLKIWCFPSPMPTEKEFLTNYMNDFMMYKDFVGKEKAREMQMDQMLFISWEKRYLCPDVKDRIKSLTQ